MVFTFEPGHRDKVGAGQGQALRGGGQGDNVRVEKEAALEVLGAQPRQENPSGAALIKGGSCSLEHGIHLEIREWELGNRDQGMGSGNGAEIREWR